jgi:hypothetical protein
MDITMYRAYGLLLPDTDFTLADAGRRLIARLPGSTVAQAGERLTLAKEDWEIHLTLRQGPEVLAESRTIAEHIGGAEDELGITRCDRRVEVESDVPDPEMDHFNDYLTVIEVLVSFGGVIGVDPDEPSLL